ncbi:50S ribosomal protein L25 [Candidatus Parcubacteria bacterium]|nr:50S ribosomal protein L25 [Candidatus Parcubacteria bacterium]
MSKADITLTAQKRNVLGKQVRRLRREGYTPAVVHQRGGESLHVSVDSALFKKAFSAAGRHHAIKLDVDGKKYTTIIKEVTNAPASYSFYHAVFQSIKEDEKVTAEVPIKLSDEIPAARANLLVLTHLDYLEVEALPKDLLDSIEVDGSTLIEAGDRLHVSDIKVPSNVTVKTDQDHLIASVETPRDQVAEADAALEEQAAAEGAVEEEPAEVEEAGETAPEPAETEDKTSE